MKPLVKVSNSSEESNNLILHQLEGQTHRWGPLAGDFKVTLGYSLILKMVNTDHGQCCLIHYLNPENSVVRLFTSLPNIWTVAPYYILCFFVYLKIFCLLVIIFYEDCRCFIWNYTSKVFWRCNSQDWCRDYIGSCWQVGFPFATILHLLYHSDLTNHFYDQLMLFQIFNMQLMHFIIFTISGRGILCSNDQSYTT